MKIKYFFKILSRWFSYFKVLRNIYDFDYSSILAVEKYQIMRVRDSIKYPERYMNLALKLLNIIEENGCSELVGNRWILPIYVNTTNSKRFCNFSKSQFEHPRTGPLMKDTLRVEKAWRLYHKLREYYMRSWWD